MLGQSFKRYSTQYSMEYLEMFMWCTQFYTLFQMEVTITLPALISIHILMPKSKLMKHIGIMINGVQWQFKGLPNQVNLVVIVLFLNIVIKFGKLSLFRFLILALHLIKELEVLLIFQILIKNYEFYYFIHFI